MKCPRCDGLGRLVRMTVDSDDPIDLMGSTDDSRVKFTTCPVCEGTGEVEDQRTRDYVEGRFG